MLNVSELNVGEEVRFRVNSGRGRPAVGILLGKQGLFVKVQNIRTGEVKNINRDRLTNRHEFKPYNMVRDEAGNALTKDGTPRKPWTASGNPRKPRTTKPKVVTTEAVVA